MASLTSHGLASKGLLRPERGHRSPTSSSVPTRVVLTPHRPRAQHLLTLPVFRRHPFPPGLGVLPKNVTRQGSGDLNRRVPDATQVYLLRRLVIDVPTGTGGSHLHAPCLHPPHQQRHRSRSMTKALDREFLQILSSLP